VAPHPELEAERPEGEQPEVEEQDHHVHQVSHVPEHRRAQQEQPQRPHHEGDPLELGEGGGVQVVHPDVVVEDVDLPHVLAVVAAVELPAVDVQAEAVLILGREQGHLPEGEDVGGQQQQGRHQDERPRRDVQLDVEEAVHPVQEESHGGTYFTIR
jgi:hypothetical protein